MKCQHRWSASGRRRTRRGSVLVIALMVTIGVAMLGACLLQFSASTTRSQIQGVDKKRAFYLAEAGLSESMYGLMVGESGNLGTPDNPAKFGDGVFWVEATKSRDGRVMLDSTGLCGSGRASLSIVVEKHGDSSASLGIFSNGDLVVRAGSRIDSYDPGAGLIEGLLGGGSGTAGRVGSNGNIEVQASKYSTTRIEGDVTPGPAGTVTSGTGVTITGSTAPRSAPFTLPAIEVPALASLGDLSHVAHETLTIPTGEHRYGALTVGTGAELLVVGPQTIVASSMVLQNGAKLAFDTSGGAVTIYVTDYMNFGASTTIDNRQHDPAKAHFMVGASQTVDRNGDGIDDPPITFSSTGKLYATIYAPSASLTLGSSLELYGAVTAANLVLSENAKLHFDEALVEDDGTGPGSVKLVSWKVLELPDLPLVGLRLDPVVALRQAGATLLSPVASHQDVEFKIEYIDKCGKDVVWAGEEAKFDWSKVVTVVVVARLTDLLFDAL